MMECPHCYRIFRATPEKLGARCPKCRMPLFERNSRRRGPEKEIGPCAKHPETSAVAKCARCGSLICVTCRTRWHDEATCPECVERSLTANEPTPQETQRQERQAWTGVVLAVVGWSSAFLVFWPLASLHNSSGGWTTFWVFLGTILFALSFVPALLALGQSASALRMRGRLKTVAMCGMVASGLQIGALIGVVVLNLWHN
jgi:hypothetical protein